MKQKTDAWRKWPFILAFCVLTVFCWCPVGYGDYGQVDRIFGIPSWAVWAFGFATILFVLEWIYLFRTPLAMNDDELPEIVAQLEAVTAASPIPPKEDQ